MQHQYGYGALALVCAAVMLPGCYGKQTLRQPITVNEIAEDVANIRREQTTISDDLDVLEVKLEEQADEIHHLRTENQYLYKELESKLAAIDAKIQDAIGRNTGFTKSGAYWSERDNEAWTDSGSQPSSESGSTDSVSGGDDYGSYDSDTSDGYGISRGDQDRVADQVSDREPDPTSTEGQAKRVYDQAYLDLTRGNYSLAILGFKEFVRRVPESDMADNAQYWIGESYYAQGDFRQAVREFGKVMDKYAYGDKVPSALLKTGFAKLQLGDRSEAVSYFRQVSDEYPESEESRLAKDKLRSIE